MSTDEIKKLINSSKNYWEKRALENKLNIIENEDDYVSRMKNIYDTANKQIDNKLAVIYSRYAKNNNMTLEDAYKKLPKAMETEYKADVNDYVEKAKSGDPKWSSYLLNQSLMHQHSVLNQMQTEYRNVIYNIDMEETGGKFLNKIYQNANYYQQYSENNEQFAQVDQNRIKALIEENWSGGGNFSENIWKNKEALVNALDDVIIKGLATGTNFDSMSKELAKRMDTSFNNARRLIMTESARMDNQGLLDWYKESKVKQFQFMATLDNRTSDICRAMDGQIFNIEDAEIGLNVPPLHPYCRSVITPYTDYTKVEERIYKDKDNNRLIGKNRTYAQYVEEELGDKKQAKAIVDTSNTLATLTNAVSSIASTTTNNIKDITGYMPDTYHIDYAYNRNKQQDEYYINKGEITQEEINELFEELKKALEDNKNEVAIRVKEDALLDILNSGKIENGFTVNKIRNFINDKRIEAERNIFNIPKTAESNERPIYGYVSNNDLENGMTGVKLQMYGDIKIILKNKVKDSCTFTLGDSLDLSNTIQPSALKDIDKRSVLVDELLDFKNNGLKGLYVYPEVQIFKQLDLSDVYEIRIPKTLKSSSLIRLLNKKKVNVNWY